MNGDLIIGAGALLGLVVAIFLHIPIPVAMAGVGLIASTMLTGNLTASLGLFADATIEVLSFSGYLAIPLFILMGGFAGLSGLSQDLFRLASAWLGWSKGGVALATVGTCAGFGAICGSSTATTATMVKLALPELKKRQYDDTLSAGVIIGGGTLGSIIPPSMVMMIYAFQAEVSVRDLFVGAFIPALIAILFCLLAVKIYIYRYPESAPPPEKSAFSEKIRSLLGAWGIILIAILMTVGIYSGWVSVEESACLGLLIALGFAYFRGHLTWKRFKTELINGACSIGMVYLILIGAKIFAVTMTQSGLAQWFIAWVLNLGLSDLAIIFTLVFIFLILGTVFDNLAAMILTLPFILPIIVELGYDKVWWGIINVMIVEVGLISPPVGISIFVFQGMNPQVPLKALWKGVTPFVLAGVARIILLIFVPSLATILL